MTLNDFAQLFPEIANPGKSFSDLLAFGRYKNYPEEEFATALIDFSLKRNNYAGYENNPAGYLWIVITNKIVKWKGGQSNSKLTLTDNLEEESYDDTPKFELKTSLEKLADFLKYIDSSTLRPGQKELVKIMIDVCKNDHDSYREFMKEVNEKAQNAGFSLENIRKLLERIRLNMRGNDGAKNLLTFIQKSEDFREEILGFMIYLSFSIDKFEGNYNWSINDSLRGIYIYEYEILKDRIMEICTDPFDINKLYMYIKHLINTNIVDSDEGGIIIDQSDLKLILRAIFEELLNEGFISHEVISEVLPILN